MPAIKLKKAAAEHQAEKEREEREREAEAPAAPKPKESKDAKEAKEPRESKEPKEAKDPSQSNSLLRGLDANILFEKRKRQIMPSEQKVMDWIDANLEVKENSHVSLQNLYDYFGEACSFDGTPVVAFEIFTKRIFNKFGKFFALKESSPYKGIIKERIGKVKAPKVKGESVKTKMKEIIEEALKEAGNPTKGVRFQAIKQYIACNYPALRVDLRPALLKTALNRGITYGYIQLVRGVGLMGLYRLPVDEEPDEEEEGAGDKKGEKADTEQQNGDSGEGGEKVEKKKKSKKKKEKEEGETEAKEGEVKEGETKEGKEGESEEAKKKKKKKKRKFPKRMVEVYGGAPQRIEDVFPMAMTYMAEPKQASFTNIKKYFIEHYPKVDENLLKKTILRGIKRGFWDPLNEKQVFNSRYELLMDEFDPNSTDNVEDMICSAIMACSEPKQASTFLLKKYILEYHPEFKIDVRPHLYKNALERGIKKGIILQLSGIGASGSFQLCDPYRPSPALLAGDEEIIEIENETYFEKDELYVPRGTKSRRLVHKTETGETRPPPTKRKPPTDRRDKPTTKPPAKSSAKSPARSSAKSSAKSAKSSSRSAKSSRGRNVKKEESEDEEDVVLEDEESEREEEEEEVEEPKPKKPRTPAKSSPKKKTNAKSSAKKGSKPVSRSQLKDDDDEEEEEVEEEADKSKRSRKSVAEEEEPAKSSRGRSKPRPNYSDDKNDSDDDEPKASRGRKSSGSKRSSRVVSYEEGAEEEDEEMAEYTPRKSKSRGGDADSESSSPKKSKKRR